MRNADATLRIQKRFFQYYAILRRDGLSQITKARQKMVVCHVLSANCAGSVQSGLRSDLEFSHRDLCKTFQGFLKHTIRLLKAFQLVDNGKQRSSTSKSEKPSRGGNRQDNESESKATKPKSKKKLRMCLYELQKSPGIRHLLRSCRDCLENEKPLLFKANADKKVCTGPLRSSRSQVHKTAPEDSVAPRRPTSSRIQIGPECHHFILSGDRH